MQSSSNADIKPKYIFELDYPINEGGTMIYQPANCITYRSLEAGDNSYKEQARNWTSLRNSAFVLGKAMLQVESLNEAL